MALLAALAVWIAIDNRGGPAGKAPAVAGGTQKSAEPTARTPRAVQSAIPERLTLGKISSDPFSAQSWLRPRSAAPAAPPPPAPVAPPLPFRFAGQFYRDSGIDIYLGRGEEIFPVKEGDTLDGQYKVESVTASEVAFVHLPSSTRQTLQFGPPLKEPELFAQGTVAAQAARTPARSSAQPAAAGTAVAAGGRTPASPETPGPGRPAQLRWDGPSSAKAGASFNVALRVTSGERIRSAPMQVRFDPAILESVAVRPGRYFGTASGNFGYRVNSDGSIFVGVSNEAATPASDAELLVLTFRPIRSGTAAEVSVASLNLQGAAGRSIAYGGMTPFKTTIIP